MYVNVSSQAKFINSVRLISRGFSKVSWIYDLFYLNVSVILSLMTGVLLITNGR